MNVDSPLYDASEPDERPLLSSEEDNDELLDDPSVPSRPRIAQVHRQPMTSSPLGPNPNDKSPRSSASDFNHQGTSHRQTRSPNIGKIHGAAIPPLDSEGTDSPTYDGDVESTAATPLPSTRPSHYHQSHLSVSTLAGDVADEVPTVTLSVKTPTLAIQDDVTEEGAKGVEPSTAPNGGPTTAESKAHNPQHDDSVHQALADGEPAPAQISGDPSSFSPEDIRAYVRAAIDGTSQLPRTYQPNKPPSNRPVRIYADGVYDIFHFGHALQLRQAKLSFESVHLLVGVCSDELCSEHKSRTVMNHAERCESVRHCRWVDEIVPDAPWVIDEAFIAKHEIDYVAHDEDPYKGSDGSDDVYHYAKSTGHFIPTRRTPGVSTSELLERIVAGYREGDWDAKLVKIGHPELASRAPSRAASRPESRLEVLKPLDHDHLNPTDHP
ncbi:hypothetical protein FRB90_010470 [Tulasnella sp. 427]|nr:hypothetical protein FRB90_010470 [Tulasnella sp. 427]